MITNKKTLLIALFHAVIATCSAQEQIKPLLKTQWGQNFPYNLCCPITMDSVTMTKTHVVAGCVPVAIAQVVRAMEYPSMSPDRKTPYVWKNMFVNFYQSETRERMLAVAKLISDCGVQSRTHYEHKGSASTGTIAIQNMKRLMHFSRCMLLLKRQFYLGEEGKARWSQIITDELKAGRPVIYIGTTPDPKMKKDKTHCFVVDGCKNGKFHLNLGWNGIDDGYYGIDDMDGFTTYQQMVINIADSNFVPKMKQINVDVPGTLCQKFSADEKANTFASRISGKLNVDDWAFLRSLCTRNSKNKLPNEMAILDLRDVDAEIMPDTAFKNCNNLVYVQLPLNLKKIPQAGFYNCIQLNYIEIPNGVTTVGRGAFAGCLSLISVDLPETVTAIERKAYRYCDALIAVNLPKSLQRIDDEVFSDCKQLRWISMPKTTKQGNAITKNSNSFENITLW